MGLFTDIIKLPLSVTADAINIINGENPDNTVENVKELVKDTIELPIKTAEKADDIIDNLLKKK